LEASLGIALFERTPRALLLTQAGAKLLEHFRSMGYAAEQISVVATGQDESLVGRIAITATEMMVTQYLLPIIKELRIKSPQLTIEIIASNDLSDLRRREADIAVRHTQPQDKKLVTKHLRDIEARLFASRQYLKEVGHPSQVSDLMAMTFVGAEDHERMLGPLALRGLNLTPANFNFYTDNATVLLELIRQGFGAGMLPVEVAVKYPELVELLPQLKPLQVGTWLVSHRELLTNPRINLVYDLLLERLV